MEKEQKDAEEAAEALKDKGKGVIIDNEEILGSSSQQEQQQPDAKVNVENVEVNVAEVDEEDDDEDEEDDDFIDIDDYHKSSDDDKGDDDDQGGNGGALIVRPPGADNIDDYFNDEQNEEKEDAQTKGESTSGSKQANLQKVFSNTPKVIYLSHDVEEREVVENWTRDSMFEALGLKDGNLKFDIEDEIPTAPDSEYVFKFVEDADNFNDVIVEDDSSDSDQDVPFLYASQDDNFRTFAELFRTHNEDDLRRKVAEKISIKGPPKTLSKEELREERKKWFKQPQVEERKFKRPLKFFTRHLDESIGGILSWGYLEDMKVYAIKREYGVQYIKFLKDIRTLPWWDVELVKTKNLQQCLHSPEVRFYQQRLWRYIKYQATLNFPDWKPHRPKRTIKVDPDTGEKDITLHVRRPCCMKNMSLKEMEQDFFKDFIGWVFNPKTCEAVITLFDAKTGLWRYIHVLDHMWLVNCSKKDIECLFFNKIMYYELTKSRR
ncbi:hypothetical protein HanLR1_Chr05g0177671 [Helianthus annuus]|nr:hypothetical protein HanLR1_Chr05g0177671 [Helianthus annuus]